MEVVQDISRPDVNGVLPKMNTIGVATNVLLKELLPHVKVETTDNLGSHVSIWGSFDPREKWSNGIFHNSRYFIAKIAPKSIYYTNGDPVCVEIHSCSGVGKFRKYTGTPEKVLAKLTDWVKNNK